MLTVPNVGQVTVTTHNVITTLKRSVRLHTSIQASGNTFAGSAFEVGSWSVYEVAGLSCLRLRTATVAELGTQGQELRFWRLLW